MNEIQKRWAASRVGGQIEIATGYRRGKWTIVDYKPHNGGVMFIVQKPGTRSYQEVYREFPASMR